MPNDELTIVQGTVLGAKRPRGFQPGHPRVGGRKAGVPTKTKLAAELCAKHKFHPLEWIVQCVKNGVSPATPDKPSQPVSMSDRTRMAETLLSFLLPRLTATQFTGANEGPIQVASLDLTKLMADPTLVAAAQRLSLAMTAGELDSDEDTQERRWERIDGPKPHLLEPSGTPDND